MPTYQPVSQPPINPAKALIGIILLLAIGALLKGCSPAKREQRLDDKAFDRVVTKQSLLYAAGSIYQTIKPCVVTTLKKDSVITKHDTIINQKTITIPKIVTKNRNLDTIVDNVSIFINDTTIVVKCLEGEKTITNNITKVIVDESLVNRLKDSLNKAKTEISYHKGREEAISEQNDNTIRQNNKLWVAIILLVLVGVLSHVARSYIPTIKLPKFFSK
jgi:hypothetical protein